MADHHHTAKQGFKNHREDYKEPENFHVDHHIDDINGLNSIQAKYDLIILDRDCTIQKYHGNKRVAEFERTLKNIAYKSEIASNSSFEELLNIRDVFNDIIPVSSLVKFKSSDDPHLLRFNNGHLSVYQFIYGFDSHNGSGINRRIIDKTSEYAQGDVLLDEVVERIKKPSPIIIHSIISYNTEFARVSGLPKVLMVGDRYLTDMVAGNLAGIDTCLVKPYKPMSDKMDLILFRYFYDLPKGRKMEKRYEKMLKKDSI